MVFKHFKQNGQCIYCYLLYIHSSFKGTKSEYWIPILFGFSSSYRQAVNAYTYALIMYMLLGVYIIGINQSNMENIVLCANITSEIQTLKVVLLIGILS